MRRLGGFFTGWLETSIGELLQETPDIVAQFAALVVSSLDSVTDLSTSGPARAVVDHYSECRFFGKSLLMPGAVVPEISSKFRLFRGFDELWCFDQEPMIHKPEDLWIVAPLNIESEDPPPNLFSWMANSSCKLGLGDGIGLNYVTPLEEISLRLDRDRSH